jgi:phosphohistidine phosphatase SixA
VVAHVADEISRMTGDPIIVGHLPFLGKLAFLLLTGSEAKNIAAFRMGGGVRLQRSEDQAWQVA